MAAHGKITPAAALFLVACGGGSSPSPAAPAAGEKPGDDEKPASAATAAPREPARAPEAAVIPLEGLMGKPAPGAAKGFPRATAKDKDCMLTVGLAGQADKDYEALGAACGTGTGMKEYVRRV